jgi:Rrf2 family protein
MAGEYAVRAMLHLAAEGSRGVVPIASIARSGSTPVTFLRKIVAQLAAAGLVTSRRGVGGGISLARPAGEITLVDIIEAVEGPVGLNRCLIEPGFCSRTGWCAVHLAWAEAQTAMRAILARRTLAELARLDAARHAAVRRGTPVPAE